MADTSEAADERGYGPLRDFILRRELAEVYLLLDHLSGRPDKRLASDIDGKSTDADSKATKWIEDICQIGWPPEDEETKQAVQASTLLIARDRLNHMAHPASGATIAFTIMVVGEDAGARSPTTHRTEHPSPFRHPVLWYRSFGSLRHPVDLGTGSADTEGSRESDSEGSSGSKQSSEHDRPTPSRSYLARLAYPGLQRAAQRFNFIIWLITAFLIIWLFVTCILSWHVAAGQAILARLESVAKQEVEITKKIADVAPGMSSVKPEPATALGPVYVTRFCASLSKAEMSPDKAAGAQSNTATAQVTCDQWRDYEDQRMAERHDIGDWLRPWRCFVGLFARGSQASPRSASVSQPSPVADEQWAGVLVGVLALSVLPVFYGVLGAGAAVVRNLWYKMRESLLAPRDSTSSLVQLALGALIGASIGLFVAPSGTAAPQGGAGLTTGVALSASALSFIAGFGVEEVFEAMHSLIKRVFNVQEPQGTRSK